MFSAGKGPISSFSDLRRCPNRSVPNDTVMLCIRPENGSLCQLKPGESFIAEKQENVLGYPGTYPAFRGLLTQQGIKGLCIDEKDGMEFVLATKALTFGSRLYAQFNPDQKGSIPLSTTVNEVTLAYLVETFGGPGSGVSQLNGDNFSLRLNLDTLENADYLNSIFEKHAPLAELEFIKTLQQLVADHKAYDAKQGETALSEQSVSDIIAFIKVNTNGFVSSATLDAVVPLFQHNKKLSFDEIEKTLSTLQANAEKKAHAFSLERLAKEYKLIPEEVSKSDIQSIIGEIIRMRISNPKTLQMAQGDFSTYFAANEREEAQKFQSILAIQTSLGATVASIAGMYFFMVKPQMKLMRETMERQMKIAEEQMQLMRQSVEAQNKQVKITDFAKDLVEVMREKLKADPNFDVLGRDKEAVDLLNALARGEGLGQNALLVGETGVGKKLVTYKAALLIAANDPRVPPELKTSAIWEVNNTQFLAGTMYRGSFTDKLAVVEAEMEKGNVPYIPELGKMMNAGSTSEGDAESLKTQLLEMLQRDRSRFIGDLKPDTLEMIIQGADDYDRRFQEVRIFHMIPSSILESLQKQESIKLETNKNVTFTPETIEAAARLGIYYRKRSGSALYDAAKGALADAVDQARQGTERSTSVTVTVEHVIAGIANKRSIAVDVIDREAGRELFNTDVKIDLEHSHISLPFWGGSAEEQKTRTQSNSPKARLEGVRQQVKEIMLYSGDELKPAELHAFSRTILGLWEELPENEKNIYRKSDAPLAEKPGLVPENFIRLRLQQAETMALVQASISPLHVAQDIAVKEAFRNKKAHGDITGPVGDGGIIALRKRIQTQLHDEGITKGITDKRTRIQIERYALSIATDRTYLKNTEPLSDGKLGPKTLDHIRNIASRSGGVASALKARKAEKAKAAKREVLERAKSSRRASSPVR